MERRTLLAGLAGITGAAALAAVPAHAQSAAPTSTPSEAAKAHARDTAAAGAQSLIVSRVALTKLRHPMTRQFAGFEAAEQEELADVLKGRLNSTAPGVKLNGATVPPTDAEVESSLDADGRTAAAKFRDMAAGPEFEKSYVEAQVDGHRKLLEVQDAYLKVADDEVETAIAKLARGRIREHLVILGDIQKHLG